jgi:hypothetical protein
MSLAAELSVRERLAREILRCRRNPYEFFLRAARTEAGRPVRPTAVHRAWMGHFNTHNNVVLFAPVAHGKALPLDTPIATPSGWIPLGELQVGDFVLGGDGLPTAVTYVSPTYTDHEVIEFTFDDGARLCSDMDHQWSAWTVNDRGEGKAPRTVTTREIVSKFTRVNGQRYWSIPLTGPAERPERDLPVHPYVLGAWLGDGNSHDARITCCDQDEFIILRCIELEGGLHGQRVYQPGTGTFTQLVGATSVRGKERTANSLKHRLSALGVLRDKHIPEPYLLASVAQRRELLAGLMDTDGCVGRLDGRMEFCNTNEELAHQVLELVRSLGYKATLISGDASLYGRVVGKKYRVGWSCTQPVFRLPRKQEAHNGWVRRVDAKAVSSASWHRGRAPQRRWEARTITAWRRVPSVPVRCIGVAGEHHTYVATNQYVVTHNTMIITIWRLIWEIGNNPDIRIAVISSSERLPGKVLGSIKAEVQLNPWVHAVFPHMKPSTTAQKRWGDNAVAFERSSRAPDPTIQIFGPYGKILGSRLDLILFDDVATWETTLGKWQRDKLFDWISGPVQTRLPNTGGRVWAVGNTWHEDDALHRLSRLRTFQSHRYSAFVPLEGGGEAPLIPEMWSIEMLREREETYGPIHGPQLLRNQLVDATSGRIRRDFFEKCLHRGRGYSLLDSWNPADAPVYTGVDLGVRKEGAVTCIFTVAVLPEGTRWLIDIRSGHWSAPEILRQLVDVHQRYGSIIAVENNSAQNFLLDFSAELSTLAIRGHTTVGRGDVGNLHHPQFGVESMGMELAQGKWRIPCDNELRPPPEVAEWIREAISYSPGSHMGDRLSASWICREAIRQSPASNIGRPTVDFSNLDTLTR